MPNRGYGPTESDIASAVLSCIESTEKEPARHSIVVIDEVVSGFWPGRFYSWHHRDKLDHMEEHLYEGEE